MGWIVEKLTEICVEGLMKLLEFFSTILTGQLALNGIETLDKFKDVFPVVTKAYTVFLYSAFAIIFLSMVYQLFKCFFGPLTDKTETPFKIILSSLFTCILVAFSQVVCAAIFEITTIPYKAITSIAEVDTITGLATPQSAPAGIGSEILSGLVVYWIILIVLLFMMLKQFIMLVLEIVERYVLMGMFTIVSPLCLACGCVAPLRNVQQSWIQVMFNSCIVMIFSTFFLTIFTVSFNGDSINDMLTLLMYIAWLKTGQKVDEHMNTLGLKTARSGGFGMDVMSALAHGLPAATAMANKIHGTNLPTRMGGGAGSGDSSRGVLGSIGHMAGLGNINKGEASTRRGIAAAIGRTKGVKSLADAANSKISNAKGALAEKMNETKIGQKLGLGEGVGRMTGMSSEELKAQREGRLGMPAKEDFAQSYQNAIHDQAEAVMGKDKIAEMENAGYKLQDMQIGEDGKVAFSFANENDGTQVVANCTPGGDTNGNFAFTDSNGDTYSTQFSASVKDGEEANLAPFTGAVDGVDDNVRPAEALNGELESSGVANETTAEVAGADGEEGTTLAAGVLNDDNTINTCDSLGNSVEGGDFVKTVDGEGNEQITALSDIGAENKQFAESVSGGSVALASDTANERFNEDGLKASDFNNVTDSNGDTRKYDTNEGFSQENGKCYAVDADSREKFEVNSSSVSSDGTVNVKDDRGNVQNQSAFQYAKGEDGNMHQVTGSNFTRAVTDREISEGDKIKIGNQYYSKNDDVAQEAMKGQSYTVALADGGYAMTSGGLRYDKEGNVSARGEYMRIKGTDNTESLQRVQTNSSGNVPIYKRTSCEIATQVRDGNEYRDISSARDSASFSQKFTPVTSSTRVAPNAALYRQDGNSVEKYASDGIDQATKTPITYMQTKDNRYVKGTYDEKSRQLTTDTNEVISSNNLVMSKSAGKADTPATYQKVISNETGMATYRSDDRSSSRVVQCSTESTYNGVPPRIDLSRCTVASEYDGKNKTGRIQITDTQTGTTYMGTPMNGPYRIASESAGAYSTIGGKRYFLEKTSNDSYASSLRTMGVNQGRTGDTAINFKQHSDTLRYEMGINTNQMKAMTVHTEKTGESHCIATYKNGDRMEIVPRIPNNVTDAQRKAYKPLTASRMKNGKVVQEVVGYQRKLRDNDTSISVKSSRAASTKLLGFFMRTR